jgi:hypothetical protein
MGHGSLDHTKYRGSKVNAAGVGVKPRSLNAMIGVDTPARPGYNRADSSAQDTYYLSYGIDMLGLQANFPSEGQRSSEQTRGG